MLSGVNEPPPVVVHIMLPVVVVPKIGIESRLSQAIVSLPALTIAVTVNITFTESITAKHVPLFVDVKNKVTPPAVVSATVTLYEPFNVVSFGVNVPEPEVVQIPLVLPPETLPFNDAIIVPLHNTIVEPALTNGDGLYVIIIVSVTAVQVPFPVEVIMIVSLPLLIAAVSGIYVVVKLILSGLNVPLLRVDQRTPVAFNTVPVNETDALFEHTV